MITNSKFKIQEKQTPINRSAFASCKLPVADRKSQITNRKSLNDPMAR
jgi:hypothetical protein